MLGGGRRWEQPGGWVHRPAAWQGYLLLIAALGFCEQAFFAIDRQSHSASDTLIGLFPFVAPAFLLLDWVASKTSSGPG